MTEDLFTWRKLKEFINSLPESELDKNILWWGEEIGGSIKDAYQLEEDFVSTDDGYEAVSLQKPLKEGKEYDIAFKKGTPIIYAE